MSNRVKFVAFGLLLWVLVLCPGSTARAQATFPVLDLQPGDMKTLQMVGSYPWRQCGRYFASVTGEYGKVTYYNYGTYRLKKDGKVQVILDWKMVPTRNIRITFDRRILAPQVEWWSDRTEVRVSTKLAREALPCITEGTPT